MASRKHYREIAETLSDFYRETKYVKSDRSGDSLLIKEQTFDALFENMVSEIAGTLKRENRAFDMTRFRDAVEEGGTR